MAITDSPGREPRVMQPPGFHTRRPRSSQIRLGGSLASCVARVANVHVVQKRARRQARRVCRDVCTLSALTGELNLIVRLCAPCPWVSDRVCVSRLPPVMPGVFGARGGRARSNDWSLCRVPGRAGGDRGSGRMALFWRVGRRRTASASHRRRPRRAGTFVEPAEKRTGGSMVSF